MLIFGGLSVAVLTTKVCLDVELTVSLNLMTSVKMKSA